jgi:hypothetical protein
MQAVPGWQKFLRFLTESLRPQKASDPSHELPQIRKLSPDPSRCVATQFGVRSHRSVREVPPQ